MPASDDARRREQQTSTFHQHAQAQADETSGGRFAATGTPTIVGQSAVPKYPQASTPFQRDPVPDEPPLSAYENPALELEPSLSSPLASAQALCAPAGADASANVAPSSDADVKPDDTGAPSSSQQTND